MKMGLADRVKEAVDKMNLGEPVNALIQVCIAVDATAGKEYPKTKVGERNKKFLRNNQAFLTRVAFGKLEVGGDILLQFEDENGKRETKKLEEVLYDLVRCVLLHEGELSERVMITPKLEFGFSKDRKFLLSAGLIWGMLLAVIGSPVNSIERVPNHYWISVGGQQLPLNELWGKREEILLLARKHNS